MLTSDQNLKDYSESPMVNPTKKPLESKDTSTYNNGKLEIKRKILNKKNSIVLKLFDGSPQTIVNQNRNLEHKDFLNKSEIFENIIIRNSEKDNQFKKPNSISSLIKKDNLKQRKDQNQFEFDKTEDNISRILKFDSKDSLALI